MASYSIGIDLGTTHSAISYLNLEEGKPRGEAQTMLPLPQLTGPGVIEDKLLLPSFLYLPSASEFPAAGLSLPWDKEAQEIVGEFARAHGAKVPLRLVSSAKSWLGHTGVDRRAALLPQGAPEDVHKLSPVDVSARFLRHLRAAYEHSLGKGAKGAGLSEQEVTVTVPASFDAGARDLTLEAAKRAGLQEVTLLEEPQAALYAWLERMGDSFRKLVKPGEVILVVDVGGGTSDFSLITVTDKDGELELTRLAVGDHILLGGDNMDLALAHGLSHKLAKEGKKLDSWQLLGLTHGCRMAKEQLFTDLSLSQVPIAVPSRGSSLVGKTLRVELTREELTSLLTEGFFPKAAVTDAPRTARHTGLMQLGLPYAQDAAITKHLGHFLCRQTGALEGQAQAHTFLHPTAVLFNGGVFKAHSLKERVMEVLNGWLVAEGGAPAKELPGVDLDLAVARGAAYYGWVRKGHGIRIRGGTARAYYVGVESSMPAVPGMAPPVRALCVAPFGMEEGTKADVPPQEFGVLVGEPTRFRFFASSVRREDVVGTTLDDVEGNEELEELAPIETALPQGERATGSLVPVGLQAAVTELGALELRCLEKGGKGRWKLELNVRMKE
jgi:molecular chaperone DnaK (HSP70)